jgi:hypothetical protein
LWFVIAVAEMNFVSPDFSEGKQMLKIIPVQLWKLGVSFWRENINVVENAEKNSSKQTAGEN